MPGIIRKSQRQFGASVAPSGNMAVWGSLAAGAPAYSNDPAAIQALPAWLGGMQSEVIGNRSPALEDLNGLFYTLAYQLAYLLERGMAEWDSTTGTGYWPYDMCRVNGTLYQVVATATGPITSNPTTDTNNWIPYTNTLYGPTIPKAWAVWDGINESGGNSRLISVFNVSTIQKIQVGQYRVNFLNPLPTDNYVQTGSCGVENGETMSTQDQATISGAFFGELGVRNQNQSDIFTIQNGGLVQSGCVSVVWFGQ